MQSIFTEKPRSSKTNQLIVSGVAFWCIFAGIVGYNYMTASEYQPVADLRAHTVLQGFIKATTLTDVSTSTPATVFAPSTSVSDAARFKAVPVAALIGTAEKCKQIHSLASGAAVLFNTNPNPVVTTAVKVGMKECIGLAKRFTNTTLTLPDMERSGNTVYAALAAPSYIAALQPLLSSPPARDRLAQEVLGDFYKEMAIW